MNAAGRSVTAIVPVHNDGESIGGVLQNLLDQDATCSLDIVVIDDASSDASAEVVQKFVEDRQNVTLISLVTNGGVAGARERGLAEATGEFVWFVDADDVIPTNALGALVEAAGSTGADVVIGAAEVMALKGRGISGGGDGPGVATMTGGQAFELLLKGRLRGQLWDKLIKRQLFDGADIVRAAVHSDLPLTAQALARADRVVQIPDVVYRYVVREGSIIGRSRRRVDSIRMVCDFVVKLAGQSDSSPDAIAYFRSRNLGLSLIRDVGSSEYSPVEQRQLLAEAKKSISLSSVRMAIASKEFSRGLTFGLAWVSPRLFLAVRSKFDIGR